MFITYRFQLLTSSSNANIELQSCDQEKEIAEQINNIDQGTGSQTIRGSSQVFTF